jgi:hypothetical protein
LGRRPDLLTRLKARDNEPSLGSSAVDQLLRDKARPRATVGEVTLHGARPDAHELGGLVDGTTGGDEGREHVHRAPGRLLREVAAPIPLPDAKCLAAAATHSFLPSMGMS